MASSFIEKQHSSRVGVTQTIAFTASSAAAPNPFGTETFQIRLAANSDCHYKIGEGAQTATTAVPANTFEYLTVTPGQRIAAIEAATNGLVTATPGTLFVTELS